MRCPNCSSLDTKQNGKRKLTPVSFDRRSKRDVQRYKCKQCKKTFIKRREKHKHYTKTFMLEVARMHVEERMSYRVISKRLRERYSIKITPGRLCSIVNEIASNVKGSRQIKEELQPKWEGYLIVDDKYINVKGNK